MNQDLIVIPKETALSVFTADDAIDPYLARIRQEIDKFVPDISSVGGRKEVASMAYKVAQSKTYLEGIGKALADQQKEIPKKIDASRKKIRDTLDAWRDEVRQPLTEWEETEDARVKQHTDAIEAMSAAAIVGPDVHSSNIKTTMTTIERVVVGPDECEEYEAAYARAKDAALTSLRSAFQRATKYEAEQAELDRLRKDAEQRAAKDREDQIRAEAAEKAKAEAEANAKATADAIEIKAKAERDAAELRELELKLAAEAAERRALETEQRLKREADEAKAKEAAETAKREADKTHRTTVNRGVLIAFVAGGLDEEAARLAITLIVKRSIPNISIQY